MKKKKYYVNFLGEKCQLVKDRYNTGGLCLNLICKNGEPMATATVNMPCCGLNDGEICIKDLDALVARARVNQFYLSIIQETL